jgi:hypothetical protein
MSLEGNQDEEPLLKMKRMTQQQINGKPLNPCLQDGMGWHLLCGIDPTPE